MHTNNTGNGAGGNSLISWTSTINKNGYIPVEGIIIGDQLISAVDGEARQAVQEAIKNAAANNFQAALTALNSIINTLNKLDKIAVYGTNSAGKKIVSFPERSVYRQFKDEENIEKNNLLLLWQEVNNQIFGNKDTISLTVGFQDDNGKIQIGYGEAEADFIEKVNTLSVGIQSELNLLSFNSSSMNISNKERAEQVFQKHYNGLLNSISQSRSSEQRKNAYIWLWYYRRSLYKDIKSDGRKKNSYGDIFIEKDKIQSGVAFEAFCSHLYTYHQLEALNGDFSVNLDKMNSSVEKEEGVPNFYHTIVTAGYGKTPYFAAGDIVFVDQNGKIKINTQVKNSKKSQYSKPLNYKSLLGLCKELRYLLQHPDALITDKAYEKLLTTALKPSGDKLNKAVQNTTNNLLKNLN